MNLLSSNPSQLNFTVELKRNLPGDSYLPPPELVPDFVLEFNNGPGDLSEMVRVIPVTFTAMMILRRFVVFDPMEDGFALVNWEIVGKLVEILTEVHQ